MTEDKEQIGRLAMRHEGKMWNAYYALPNTMDAAILLGSIAMAAIVENKDRKNAFMDMMREIVDDIIEEITEHKPTWSGKHSAPESERSGHS